MGTSSDNTKAVCQGYELFPASWSWPLLPLETRINHLFIAIVIHNAPFPSAVRSDSTGEQIREALRPFAQRIWEDLPHEYRDGVLKAVFT